jgi:hypothetical protein
VPLGKVLIWTRSHSWFASHRPRGPLSSAAGRSRSTSGLSKRPMSRISQVGAPGSLQILIVPLPPALKVRELMFLADGALVYQVVTKGLPNLERPVAGSLSQLVRCPYVPRLSGQAVNGRPHVENRASSGEIAAAAMQSAQRLVSLEIALAKQELREIAMTNIKAAMSIAAAGLIAMLAVLVALPVMVVFLVPWHWAAALVWAVAYIVIAAGLTLYGKSRFSLRLPTKTIESLKENKEWALHQMRSTGR